MKLKFRAAWLIF